IANHSLDARRTLARDRARRARATLRARTRRRRHRLRDLRRPRRRGWQFPPGLRANAARPQNQRQGNAARLIRRRKIKHEETKSTKIFPVFLRALSFFVLDFHPFLSRHSMSNERILNSPAAILQAGSPVGGASGNR